MGKKLVFSFYLNENFNDEINEIHFKCLEHFKNCFDEIDVSFLVDEGYNKIHLDTAQKRFISIFNGKDISFSIRDNNQYRESSVFYEKIASRLNEEELVFFAHNKGLTNVLSYSREDIYTWVTGMYFYCLNFMNEVYNDLFIKKFYSYGSFLSVGNVPERCNKYGWYYLGTFFWINTKKLYQHMKNENIDMPLLSDRFYAEEFLGNIIPSWPLIFTSSHEWRYIENCGLLYYNTRSTMDNIYDTKKDNFDNFYNEVIA